MRFISRRARIPAHRPSRELHRRYLRPRVESLEDRRVLAAPLLDFIDLAVAEDSSAKLTAIVLPNATTGKIAVATSVGGDQSAASFAVPSAAPRITSFSPPQGAPGTSVTIKGENFSGAISVTFNSVQANFTVVSATSIVAIVPPRATTGKIGVATSLGADQSPASFIVLASVLRFDADDLLIAGTDGVRRRRG